MEQITETKENKLVWAPWAKVVAVVDIIVTSGKLGIVVIFIVGIAVIASGVDFQYLQLGSHPSNYTQISHYNNPDSGFSAVAIAVASVMFFIFGMCFAVQLWADFKLLGAVYSVKTSAKNNCIHGARTWISVTVIILVVHILAGIWPLISSHSFVVTLIGIIWRGASIFIVKKFKDELQDLRG